MDWTEITVTINNKDVDITSDIANEVVPYGIYIEDYTNLEQDVEEIAHIDLIDEDLLKRIGLKLRFICILVARTILLKQSVRFPKS